MSKFEESLSWILTDFKAGRINFGETILKIEEIIAQNLGLNMYRINKLDEVIKYYEEKNKIN